MDHYFLCCFIVLCVSSWYIEARSITYDDLKTEINDLRSIIDRLNDKTDKQDIRINELEKTVRQENRLSVEDTRLSRKKRGLLNHENTIMYVIYRFILCCQN